MSDRLATETRSASPPNLKLGSELRHNFSVVIPAFNESDNIPELFRELSETFQRFDLNGEVILVDDGSTDGTGEVARREAHHLSRFRLERHRRNLGKTEALLTGARVAGGEWLILFDADLQHLPEEIPRLLAETERGYDIVCGRKVGKYRKRLVSGVYNWLARRIFGVPAHDLNSIKVFRRALLDELRLRHDWHRFFVVLAHARGYRVGEIDVTLYPRRRGESKYTGSGRVFVGLLDLLAVWFQLQFSRKPMLFFGFTGLLIFILGFLVGVVAVIMRLMGQGFRPLLDLVVLLGVIGISLFGFGFLAEMVASVRAEMDELRESVRELENRNR